MLAKCSNPACGAQFRYYHEGELFVFETKPGAHAKPGNKPVEYPCASSGPHYFWLCSSCSSVMTVQWIDDRVTVVAKEAPGRSKNRSQGVERSGSRLMLFVPPQL